MAKTARARKAKTTRPSLRREEIEQGLQRLVSQPFDGETFPYDFLHAFGEREDSLKRLRQDNAGMALPPGHVVKKGEIHIAVCPPGAVEQTLGDLHPADIGLSPEEARTQRKQNRYKVRFLLVTDGKAFAAADLTCATRDKGRLADLPDCMSLSGRKGEATARPVFFGPLAGLNLALDPVPRTLNEYAAKQLHQLYVQLRQTNPGQNLNHFMAQLIFCFFAQDTGIFYGKKAFTTALKMETESCPQETHHYMAVLFRTLDRPVEERTEANTPSWTREFPYVNGNLFSGDMTCPVFNDTARSYLFWAEDTNWRKIDPDIFGTMIQVITGPEKRGVLGAHYTSPENILRVLNPLFLDDLQAALEAAGQSRQKLLRLKEQLSRIRVFDPACGSGNFLVIAYKELRRLQDEIDTRLKVDQATRRSIIPLKHFHGIEIEPFCTEIARLALIVAEFQCNEVYTSQKQAIHDLLPLEDTHGTIRCGNALRLDWLEICPPDGEAETYICGNPPYKGSTYQTAEQKQDIDLVFQGRLKSSKSLDYIAGWFMKAVEYGQAVPAPAAFVSTNSICQGQQVPLLWPLVFQAGYEISFAYESFKWSNHASHKAGVTVTIIGLAPRSSRPKSLYSVSPSGQAVKQTVETINAYLVPGKNIIVETASHSPVGLAKMVWGNKPVDGGHLFLTEDEKEQLVAIEPEAAPYIKRFLGSVELIRGLIRYCLWFEDNDLPAIENLPEISKRLKAVATVRAESKAAETRPAAAFPHRFRQIQDVAKNHAIIIPSASSENRSYLPVDLVDRNCIIGNSAFAIYDGPLWSLALIASSLHMVWVKTVCGKLKTDFRYSNTMGWNTFPVPQLTETDRAELTESAAHILLTRERHFPATIADLYDAERMPADLRAAHERNDELVERIFAGKLFRNDTERLELLFDLYSQMVARPVPRATRPRKPTSRKGTA